MATTTGAVSGARLRALARRQKWTGAEAREVAVALEASGLKLPEFARRYGMSAWRVWSARKRAPVQADAPAMLRVTVREAEPSGGGGFEVIVGGAVVRVPRGFEAGELRRVVTALGREC